MKIAVIADHLQPVAAPFAGGLEAMTWYLTTWCARQGHDVTLFAARGSQVPGVTCVPLTLPFGASDVARHDVSMPEAGFLDAHHAYLEVIRRLASREDGFELIHLHSLHHLPVALAGLLGAPSVLSLHSPPTPWLESALTVAGADAPRLVAVSRANGALWSESFDGVEVIPNGVDLDCWPQGEGRAGCAVWSGRFVPEKAPHLAVQAARLAGMALTLAGPIEDRAYFNAAIAPHLGAQVRYAGLLDHVELARLIADSVVLLQTPQWAEPFCLSAAEAIACGTPVAAFDRGGLSEVLGTHGGVLAECDDVSSLAAAATAAAALPRDRVRAHAEARLSLDRCGRAYIDLYRRLINESPAGRSPRGLALRVD